MKPILKEHLDIEHTCLQIAPANMLLVAIEIHAVLAYDPN